MYDIITIGGATLDVFMRDSQFEVAQFQGEEKMLCLPFGDKIIVDETHFTYGGGGMNTAVSFASLGLKTAFLGVVGDDEISRGIESALEKAGVSTDFLIKIRNSRPGLSVALHAWERERTILLYRGTNDRLTADLISIGKSKWIYLSHLSGKSDELINSFLPEFIQKNKINLAWNPGSTQLMGGVKHLKKLLALTTILNLNKEEAEKLAGIKVTRPKDLDEKEIGDLSGLLKKIASFGPKIVVITDGRRGAAVLAGGRTFGSKNFEKGPVVDTTGAGDAFGSGFTAGYIKAGNPKEALKWGIIQSGAVITAFGAQNGLLSEKDLKKNRRQVKTDLL